MVMPLVAIVSHPCKHNEGYITIIINKHGSEYVVDMGTCV